MDNFRFEDDGFNWYKNNKIIEEIIAVLKWKKMKSTNKTVRKPREMNMIYKKQNEMDENKKTLVDHEIIDENIKLTIKSFDIISGKVI